MAKSKKKPLAKAKPLKKAAAKSAKPVKKSPLKPAKKSAAKPAAKKPTPKKSAAKVAVKKPVAKTAVKKTASKSSVKKATAVKPPAKKATPNNSASSKAVSQAKPAKKLDFSGFVTPLDDRVMVEVAEAPKKTAGGLYIPDTVTSVTGNLEGLVVSVGRGRLDQKGKVHPMDLKVGDKVMFPEYSASKIKIQDQDLMILRESDVLGVVG